jgi:hypothetical protein
MACSCAFSFTPLPWSRLPAATPSPRTFLAAHGHGCRSVVVCAAKQPRKRGSRRRPEPQKRSARSGDREKDNDDLTSAFVEDVRSPLQPGKFGEPRIAARQREAENKEKQKIGRIFERGKTLELLKQATWAGVYLLVGTFLVTHLVIVRDWIPKGPP